MKNKFIFAFLFFIISSQQASALTLQQLQERELIFGNENTVAQTIIKPSNLPSFDTTDGSAISAVQSVLFNAIDVVLIFAGILSVIFIVIGGFMYVINAGQEELQTRAKNTILYAIAGLITVLLSYAIVENIIRYLYNDKDVTEITDGDEPEESNAVDADYKEDYQSIPTYESLEDISRQELVSQVQKPFVILDAEEGTFKWTIDEKRKYVIEGFYNNTPLSSTATEYSSSNLCNSSFDFKIKTVLMKGNAKRVSGGKIMESDWTHIKKSSSTGEIILQGIGRIDECP